MLRTFYRVVVVSAFALSLAVGTPAVQAQREPPVQARSWIEEVGEWLRQFLKSQEKPKATKKSVGQILYATNSGPCIDPLGRPKPCS